MILVQALLRKEEMVVRRVRRAGHGMMLVGLQMGAVAVVVCQVRVRVHVIQSTNDLHRKTSLRENKGREAMSGLSSRLLSLTRDAKSEIHTGRANQSGGYE